MPTKRLAFWPPPPPPQKKKNKKKNKKKQKKNKKHKVVTSLLMGYVLDGKECFKSIVIKIEQISQVTSIFLTLHSSWGQSFAFRRSNLYVVTDQKSIISNFSQNYNKLSPASKVLRSCWITVYHVKYCMDDVNKTQWARCLLTDRWVYHDDVIKWKHFPRYLPILWGIHSPHKGQWRGALMLCFLSSAPE